MRRGFTIRASILTGLLLVGLYVVAPTFMQDQLRPSGNVAAKSQPWYRQLLPKSMVKLGLDLRGGVHLVLGVEVDKAVENELNRYTIDLREMLTDAKIATKKIEPQPQSHAIIVELNRPEDRAELLKFFQRKFSVFQLSREISSTQLSFQLIDQRLKEIETDTIAQALETIRNRVDQFGVSEADISTQGRTRIIIQLPGLDDPERARQLIGKTAQLEFKLVSKAMDEKSLLLMVESAKKAIQEKLGKDHEPTVKEINEQLKDKIPKDTVILFGQDKDANNKQIVTIPYLIESKVLLSGEMLEDAHMRRGGDFNEPAVSIRFDQRGADIFEKVTRENVQRQLAIILDDKVNSTPQIREPIAGGEAQITLGQSMDYRSLENEAHDLVIVLRAGALPAPVEILENRSVGPSLGSDSIRQGTKSMIIGSFAVFLFMIFYYRFAGVIANIALFFNLLYMLVILAIFEGTLTLPGIAGLVLTLGMAVDANIIIYERIREELGIGKSMATAIAEGFERAHITILDSNLTTLIAGLVLLQYGSGPTKGFAVTLIIGLFTSYVTSIWISKLCFEILVNRNWLLTNLFKPKRSAPIVQ